MMQSHTLFRQHLVSAYKGEEFKCINTSGEGKKKWNLPNHQLKGKNNN